MADEPIRIDLESDVSEGEQAAATLARVDDEVQQLTESFVRARDAQGRFVAGQKQVKDSAEAAAKALASYAQAGAKAAGAGGGGGGPKANPDRLQGKERAAAFSRLGLFTANTAQDMIQGGPASGINNILGAAGDKGIKALGAEALAAAGGIAVVGTTLAVAAAAAAAFFLVVDTGLKAAELDWSDFDDVVGNLGPIEAAGEAIAGFGSMVTDAFAAFEDTAIGAATVAFVESIGSSITTAISFVDEYTLGWGRATDAAKLHKEELARGLKQAREYTAAVKELGKFQSAEQKQQEKTGKLVGQELADLGGAGGVEGLARKLAEKATLKGGDDKVKVQEEVLDKHGKGTGEYKQTEITRREAAYRDIMARFGQAMQGDPNALGDVQARIKGAGLDGKKLADAAKGIDPAETKKAAKKAADAKAKADKEAAKQATARTASGEDAEWEAFQEGNKKHIKARKKKAKEDLEDEDADWERFQQENKDYTHNRKENRREALDAADKATAGTNLDGRGQEAILRSMLQGGDKKAVIDRVEQALKQELIASGLSEDQAGIAAKEKAARWYGKAGDEIQGEAADPAKTTMKAPERIGIEGFARSVEQAGASDQKKIASNTEEMKKQLVELNRNLRGGLTVGP